MKKKLFFGIFLLTFVLTLVFIRSEISALYRFIQIQQAPQTTKLTDVKPVMDRQKDDYYAIFSYQVAGQTYQFRSLKTSENIVIQYTEQYLTGKDKEQVVYASQAPQYGMLIKHYETRKKAGLFQEVMLILIAGILGGLLGTLVCYIVMVILKAVRII